MIKLSELIEKKNNTQGKEKLTRDVFLYLDPKEPRDSFAQCSTCRMWTTKDTCSILGKTKVTGDMSCGLYVHGKPSPSLFGKEIESVTPKEAGLVNRQVRCENCRSFDKKTSVCMLFQSLNKSHSDIFQLEEKVNEYGCCNAQKPV